MDLFCNLLLKKCMLIDDKCKETWFFSFYLLLPSVPIVNVHTYNIPLLTEYVQFYTLLHSTNLFGQIETNTFLMANWELKV